MPADRPTVALVGLGPGDVDLLTPQATRALGEADVVVLRTRRHPACDAYGDALDCDDLYEEHDDLGAVYDAIVERVVGLAQQGQRVAYAVPGSVAVAEAAIRALRSDPRIAVAIVDGLSFVELAWSRLGIDPFEHGVRLIDGHEFDQHAAGVTGPMLVGQCDTVDILSDIKLSAADGPSVTVLQRLGLPDESVRTVEWNDLDRDVEPDHLTSVYVPGRGLDLGASAAQLERLVRRLRADCPWDRRQTHESLVRYLIEETYELVDAIAMLDPETGEGIDELAEELGDVAFQVVFHGVLGAEQGWFDLTEVLTGVHDKLVARHPHVFAPGVSSPTESDLVASWEALKREEKGRSSIVDGIAVSLPSLALAAKAQRKAATVNVERVSTSPEADLLWTAMRAVVDSGHDPEAVLRAAALDVLDQVRAAGH